jgi:uncharacterized membrane protein
MTMPQNLDPIDAIWGVVLAIHLLAMATWIGGLIYSLSILQRSLGLLDTTPRMNVHLQTLNRFFRIVWMVMPTSLVTGWAMMVGKLGGPAAAPWYVNGMQGLALLMAAVFLWIFFGPYRRLRRAIRPQQATLDAVRSLMVTNLALGVATVTVASLGHFAT